MPFRDDISYPEDLEPRNAQRVTQTWEKSKEYNSNVNFPEGEKVVTCRRVCSLMVSKDLKLLQQDVLRLYRAILISESLDFSVLDQSRVQDYTESFGVFNFFDLIPPNRTASQLGPHYTRIIGEVTL